MNTQKLLISGLLGGIAAFFGGWLIYGILLNDFMEQNTGSATGVMRSDTEMVWWALIAGNLLYGLLFSYLFNKLSNINTLAVGLSAGAVIGLLMSGAFDLMMYGTSHLYNLSGMAMDIVAGTAFGALTGAVVGWANGWGAKKATA